MTPNLDTVAQQPTAQGELRDIARLTNGNNPTGTIRFDMWNTATCTGAPIFTNTQTVTGNGTYTTPLTPPQGPGTYRWIASYSGDANNNPVAGVCNDPTETVTIAAPALASPSIFTVAQGPNAQNQLWDVARLVNGNNPTGTITYRLFTTVDCTGTPIFTDTDTVTGNGSYTSAMTPPQGPGTYRWIASYSGDANNNPASGFCNDPDETTTIAAPPPVVRQVTNIETQASGAILLGGAVTDTATLTGGANPTGTITFRLYGPSDTAVCTANNLVFTDVRTVNGNGNYTSGAFVPTQVGTYRWIASYSGDPANQPDEGVCNDPNEDVTVSPAVVDESAISVTKSANPLSRPVPGGSFTFTVVVTNTGARLVTVTSLTDDIYGNLATRPGSTCGQVIGLIIGPGQSTPPCSFTVTYTSNVPASQTDVVTATAIDSLQRQRIARDDATISITGLTPGIQTTATTPTILVVKDAFPSTRPAPGGDFEFRVRVTNTSDEVLTLVSLDDTIYGGLDDLGTCSTPQTLDPGETYQCSFTGVFLGDAGDSETDVVHALAVDRDGNQARDSDDETITLTAAPDRVIVPVTAPPPVTTLPPVTPTTTPPTVLPRVIVSSGSNSADRAAMAIVLVSFGLLMIGLADERKRHLRERTPVR